ncbi:MAG: lysophospholipid acyltransferase family protein [Campylobacterales bacterium]
MIPKIRMFFFYILLMVIFTISIFFMAVFKNSDSKIRTIRKAIVNILVNIFPFRAEVKGSFDNSAKILVINHQSDLDIIFLEYILDANPCWVAKKELGDIPFFGLALKLPKMILIDRKNKKEIIRMIRTTKERIKEGRVICIFPEGTRGDGKKLLPFKEGVKAIISTANAKIQPVIIKGSREVFDPKNFKINKKKFSVEFLEAYRPDFKSESWYDELENMMRKRFEG